MPDTLIENPILNSPYREPTRHFHFGEEGITNEIVETRRPSTYFVPIPPPEKKGKQLVFDTEWTEDRIETNDKVNQIRERVSHWREGDYQGITQVTRKLLQHWTDALWRDGQDRARGQDRGPLPDQSGHGINEPGQHRRGDCRHGWRPGNQSLSRRTIAGPTVGLVGDQNGVVSIYLVAVAYNLVSVER